jgi:fibronectin-binding autotransporter adhesin
MANGNFVVHNGLTVGLASIDATTGAIYSDNYLFANSQPATTTIANSAEITANATVGTSVGLSLTATGVSAGNYGSATSIPTIVVDSKGRITGVTTNTAVTSFGLVGTGGTGSVTSGGQLSFAATNGMSIAASGSTLTVATPQDIRTTAAVTFANLTVTGATQLTGLLTSISGIAITNSTPSPNTTTGALTVAGGVGISGAINAGGTITSLGNIVAASGTTSSNTATGALVVQGGAGVSGAVYAGSVFDSGTRVVSTSSGSGNLTISGTVITLTATGPGVTTVGNSSAIPIITTDAYGRVTSLSTASITTTLGIAGDTGTGTVALASQSLAITSGTGITTSASGQAITITNAGVTSLASSGAGNVTVSSSTGSITVGLPLTGPGATTVGSSSTIPVITTDAYGRVTALSTASISTTLNTSGTTGTGAVALASQTLTFSSTNGFQAAVSGTTVSLSSPQDIRSTATPQFAGLTTNGVTQVNGTLGATGVVSVTNNTASTGAGNGALVVTGGAGVGGTSYFGGDLYVTGNIFTPNLVATSTSTLNVSSPLVYLTASPFPYNFETGIYSHFIGGSANVYAHTGMVRNHNNNYWTFFSNVKSEPTSTTINFADAGLIYDTVQAGTLILANTTQSFGGNTGALQVAGGASIGQSLNVNNAGYFGYLAQNTLLTNPTLVSTSSSQALQAGQFFVQTAVINGAGTGSADMIAYPNNYPGVTDDHGWSDVGFTGNLFSDPSFGITKANDGYFFVSAVNNSGLGGNLVLATDNTGTYNDIVIATGSFAANAEVARFHGNATTGGYFQLTQGTAATSTSTGALRVTGGAGITGNLYAGGVYTNSLNFANGSPFTSTTLANTSDITANIPSGANAGLSLTATGVTAGNYGSATSIPTIVVDSKGRISSITTNAISSSLTLTGDVTASGSLSGSISATLAASGVTAGTYGSATSIPTIVVDSKGRITSVTSNVVSTTISLAGTSGTGSVSGGGTLTFTGGTGITTSISGSTVTITGAATGVTSIAGTTNQVIASASTGAVTLSLPQSINIGAAPTFAGTNFTSLPAAQLTGTISSTVLGASTVYIGTTAIALNRTSASQTLTGISIDGTATNQSGGTIAATTGTFSGNVTRTSRPLITNYSGNVAPASPLQGDEWFRGNTGSMYKYVYDNVSSTYNWLNMSSALYNAATAATANTLALRDGSGNLTATNFIGVASSAKYADLAENYAADQEYPAGTVVVFGGDHEITVTNFSHDTRVAGVISTNPAYLMNSDAVGLPVAFTGRVPCVVTGIIEKGDILVTSNIPGIAQKMETALYRPGCIIGKALGENTTDTIATIEVVVGRF